MAVEGSVKLWITNGCTRLLGKTSAPSTDQTDPPLCICSVALATMRDVGGRRVTLISDTETGMTPMDVVAIHITVERFPPKI